MVKAVPSTATPEVADGAVHALDEVGPDMVIGGTFSTVDGEVRNHLAAFHRASGDLSSVAFDVNGPVYAVAAGVRGGTAFIGGDFTTVGGVPAKNVALVNLSTGKPVRSWKSPDLAQGYVEDIEVLGDRVFLAGTFVRAGGRPHAGLATVSAATGAVDSYVRSQFLGHHNDSGTGAQGRTGLREIEISPDGRRLVGIGNFKTVDGMSRDQIVMLNLGASRAIVTPDWSTTSLKPYCNRNAIDSYVRGVDFSPDGSFIVVSSKGGYHRNTVCDASARFEVFVAAADVRPTWVAETGGDTVWATTITAGAVFVGGHNKWTNNPIGKGGVAGPGAVPRPGLMALDPQSGRPLSWNPGRNPRGVTVYQILATRRGIYVASDTGYIGDRLYYRPRIAFFPNGGRPLVSTAPTVLPGTVYIGRASTRSRSPVDAVVLASGGRSRGPATRTSITLPQAARGTFVAGGYLFYGDSTRAKMVRRPVSATSVGAQTVLDPYHDRYWKDVRNGSGGTYDGADPTLNADWGSVTSATYANGRVYYSRSGDTALRSRLFAPDSGVMDENVMVLDTSSVDPSTFTGMFVSGRTLYFTNTSGQLLKVKFNGRFIRAAPVVLGGPTVDGVDYSGTFLYFLGAPAD